jgi:hypothetical protein
VLHIASPQASLASGFGHAITGYRRRHQLLGASSKGPANGETKTNSSASQGGGRE